MGAGSPIDQWISPFGIMGPASPSTQDTSATSTSGFLGMNANIAKSQMDMNNKFASKFLGGGLMPDNFLNIFLGGSTQTNSLTPTPNAGTVAKAQTVSTAKYAVESTLQSEKQALADDVTSELALYKESLVMLASQLDFCDWDCVKNCSDISLDINSKSKCLDTCGCYESKEEEEAKPKASFDYSKYLDPTKN